MPKTNIPYTVKEVKSKDFQTQIVGRVKRYRTSKILTREQSSLDNTYGIYKRK